MGGEGGDREGSEEGEAGGRGGDGKWWQGLLTKLPHLRRLVLVRRARMPGPSAAVASPPPLLGLLWELEAPSPLCVLRASAPDESVECGVATKEEKDGEKDGVLQSFESMRQYKTRMECAGEVAGADEEPVCADREREARADAETLLCVRPQPPSLSLSLSLSLSFSLSLNFHIDRVMISCLRALYHTTPWEQTISRVQRGARTHTHPYTHTHTHAHTQTHIFRFVGQVL